ncbi:MAG: family 43 glycosylhydrolase [Verrucomicrobia bacterium]|nr:family 43 glycosylhydrolase [Verrucomicrobiota bacterium]
MPLLRANDIQIRDPFVLPHAADGFYYLYGTTDTNPWNSHPGVGFDTYRSHDLIHWEGPFPAFRPPADFWAPYEFWAPEVHAWRGRFYMFATFASPTVHRGTQILVADHPLGPFRPHSAGPVTPADCECLDGTLHVAPDGRPWMIFSRDWPQVTVGRYSAVPLREDFSAAAGEAIEVFPVNAAPWVKTPPWQAERVKENLPPCYVADGAWPFRLRDGTLALLFSSWTATGYATGLARSPSGALHGPWVFDEKPFFDTDGGHAMIFNGFDGVQYLTLHQPNSPAPEHPRFFPLEEAGGTLRLHPPLPS